MRLIVRSLFLSFVILGAPESFALKLSCKTYFLQMYFTAHLSQDDLAYTSDPATSKAILQKLGFVEMDGGLMSHPELAGLEVALVENSTAGGGRRSPGHFVHVQRVPGKVRVLNPKWIEGKDFETVLNHIDEILELDFKPVLTVNASLIPKGIAKVLTHETTHYEDSLLPEGKRRFAIQIINGNTDPRYAPEALAYDVFTELRAYGADGNPAVRPALLQLDEMLRKEPTDARVEVIRENSKNLVRALWDLVKIHYLSDDPNFRFSDVQLEEAGNRLADLMMKYKLTDRLNEYSAPSP